MIQHILQPQISTSLDIINPCFNRSLIFSAVVRQALPRALLVALLSALRTRRSGVHAMLQLAEALVAWVERPEINRVGIVIG